MESTPESGHTREDAIALLKSRSLAGIGVLIKRQAAIKLLSFLASIALARLLAPQVFGIYAIVLFVVQFFSTFGDVGIGAALIQKKGELEKEELSSTFWLQQLLVWTVSAAAWALAPLALKIYPSLPPYSVWLIRAMVVSFALSSLKTIPAILMERRLDFRRIAFVDISETLVFYGIAVMLAAYGFDVWSFIIAALARSASGTAMMYALSGWRPSAFLRPSLLGGLVRFGLPYQGNAMIGFVKDAVTPVFIGVYAGAAAVGFVNWAKSFAMAPLMISEAFGRVAFPAFAKIQADREMLARAVERSTRSITLVMLPVAALMLALGPELVRVVFTGKWLPALPAFYFYCTALLATGVVLPMYSAILALGQSGVVLRMTAGLLVLEWGLGVPLVLTFGFNGIAFAQPVIAILFYLVYRRVLRNREVRPALLRNIRPQFVSASAAFAAAKMAMPLLPVSPSGLCAAALSGAAAYLAAIYLVGRPVLKEFIADFLELTRGVK